MKEEETIINEAKKLLSFLGLEGGLKIRKDGDYYYLEIESPDSALLIGRYGANLEAFELILNLVLVKKIDNLAKIIVDVSGFRKKREEELAALAQKIAQKVKESGQPEVIFNLSSRERRVIHLTLSKNGEIETTSEGEDKERRLIIKLKREA
jgi:spoIIIJ-associated protein